MLKCPKCDKVSYGRISCLCSNLPQYEYECMWCNFNLHYFNRVASRELITQKELDDYYNYNNLKLKE